MSRDSIRTAIFAEKVSRSVVTLDNGAEVEVRDGNVGDMLDAISVDDVKKRVARLLINSCYVPGTEEKVFEEADFDSLMELPANGVYKKLMDAVNERANLDTRTESAGKD